MAFTGSDQKKAGSDIIFSDLPPRGRAHLSCIHSLNSKKLLEWCEKLNFFNIEEVIPSMVNLFKELAEVDLDADDIFQLYLIIRPTLNRVQESVGVVYSQKKLQLTAQSKRAMEFAHSLDRAVILMLRALMAKCHKGAGSSPKMKQLNAMAGAHVFIHMGEIFVRLSEFSLPMPKGFWRECHGIFWFLRECDCDTLKFEQLSYFNYPDGLSPRSLYCGLLLYAIVEPSRYDRQLQRDIWFAMLEFSRYVDLSEKPVSDGLFSVLLTEDVSHVPVRALAPSDLPEYMLYLKLNTLTTLLQNPTIDKYKISNNERVIRLFDDFHSFYTVERFRRQSRHELQVHVNAHFGLFHIFKYLLQDSSSDDHSGHAEEIHYDTQSDHLKLKSETLVVKDESQGGFCVESLNKNRLTYDAGDLVWLSSVQFNHLCVIRWTKLQLTGHSLIGLEKLSSHVYPVQFAILGQSGLSDFEKALLFNDGSQTVILSRVVAMQGQSLKLNHDSQEKDYKVTEVHWLVSGYVQIILEPLE